MVSGRKEGETEVWAEYSDKRSLAGVGSAPLWKFLRGREGAGGWWQVGLIRDCYRVRF